MQIDWIPKNGQIDWGIVVWKVKAIEFRPPSKNLQSQKPIAVWQTRVILFFLISDILRPILDHLPIWHWVTLTRVLRAIWKAPFINKNKYHHQQ